MDWSCPAGLVGQLDMDSCMTLVDSCDTLVDSCDTLVARVWGPFLSWPCAILVVGMLVSSALGPS